MIALLLVFISSALVAVGKCDGDGAGVDVVHEVFARVSPPLPHAQLIHLRCLPPFNSISNNMISSSSSSSSNNNNNSSSIKSRGRLVYNWQKLDALTNLFNNINNESSLYVSRPTSPSELIVALRHGENQLTATAAAGIYACESSATRDSPLSPPSFIHRLTHKISLNIDTDESSNATTTMMQQRSLVTQFQWLAVRNSSLLARIDLNATRVRAMPSADYQLVYFVNQTNNNNVPVLRGSFALSDAAATPTPTTSVYLLLEGLQANTNYGLTVHLKRSSSSSSPSFVAQLLRRTATTSGAKVRPRADDYIDDQEQNDTDDDDEDYDGDYEDDADRDEYENETDIFTCALISSTNEPPPRRSLYDGQHFRRDSLFKQTQRQRHKQQWQQVETSGVRVSYSSANMRTLLISNQLDSDSDDHDHTPTLRLVQFAANNASLLDFTATRNSQCPTNSNSSTSSSRLACDFDTQPSSASTAAFSISSVMTTSKRVLVVVATTCRRHVHHRATTTKPATTVLMTPAPSVVSYVGAGIGGDDDGARDDDEERRSSSGDEASLFVPLSIQDCLVSDDRQLEFRLETPPPSPPSTTTSSHHVERTVSVGEAAATAAAAAGNYNYHFEIESARQLAARILFRFNFTISTRTRSKIVRVDLNRLSPSSSSRLKRRSSVQAGRGGAINEFVFKVSRVSNDNERATARQGVRAGIDSPQHQTMFVQCVRMNTFDDDGNASFYVLMCACLAIVVLLSLSFFLWLVRNRKYGLSSEFFLNLRDNIVYKSSSKRCCTLDMHKMTRSDSCLRQYQPNDQQQQQQQQQHHNDQAVFTTGNNSIEHAAVSADTGKQPPSWYSTRRIGAASGSGANLFRTLVAKCQLPNRVQMQKTIGRLIKLGQQQQFEQQSQDPYQLGAAGANNNALNTNGGGECCEVGAGGGACSSSFTNSIRSRLNNSFRRQCQIVYKEDYDAIPILLFEEYVRQMHIDGDFGFAQLYEEITNVTKSYAHFTSDTSLIDCNRFKNRYSNILTYDHSRVKLTPDDKENVYGYVNANYVDGYVKQNAYIATQGPMPNTFADFWQMIWENNCSIVVMITNIKEKGRIKCDQYWPDESSETYGLIQVTHVHTIALAFYTKRLFSIKLVAKNQRKKNANLERLVYQYHFTDWPDHGVPFFILPVLNFIKKSSRANPQPDGGPIVVHCSAGVGRTGTYIVIDAMIRQCVAKSTINVHTFLKHIRQQRNYLVQTEEQFIFIYDALIEALKSGDTELTAHNYVEYMQKLSFELTTSSPHAHEQRSLIERHYELITEFVPRDYQISIAFMPFNVHKNRSLIVPVNASRVVLSKKSPSEDPEYINASYFHGPTSQREFIVTQYPTSESKLNFWQMVWDNNSTQIVMLNADETAECEPYWLPASQTLRCDDTFSVQLVDESFEMEFVWREFLLRSIDEDYEFTCKMITASYWPDTCEPIATSFELVNKVKACRRLLHPTPTPQPPQSPHQLPQACSAYYETSSTLQLRQSVHAPPIIVHDLCGGSRAATFCALYTIQELVQLERCVDIYELAKMYHLKRPGVWSSSNNIKFLYKIAENMFDELAAAQRKQQQDKELQQEQTAAFPVFSISSSSSLSKIHSRKAAAGATHNHSSTINSNSSRTGGAGKYKAAHYSLTLMPQSQSLARPSAHHTAKREQDQPQLIKIRSSIDLAVATTAAKESSANELKEDKQANSLRQISQQDLIASTTREASTSIATTTTAPATTTSSSTRRTLMDAMMKALPSSLRRKESAESTGTGSGSGSGSSGGGFRFSSFAGDMKSTRIIKLVRQKSFSMRRAFLASHHHLHLQQQSHPAANALSSSSTSIVQQHQHHHQQQPHDMADSNVAENVHLSNGALFPLPGAKLASNGVVGDDYDETGADFANLLLSKELNSLVINKNNDTIAHHHHHHHIDIDAAEHEATKTNIVDQI